MSARPAQPRSGASKWSDPTDRERAVRQLAAGLDPPGRYPTSREFYAAGLGGLYLKIERTGGRHAAMATALGLDRVMPADWSDRDVRDRAVRDLAATLDPPGRYPTRSEFAAAGLGGLCRAIDAQPGAHRRLAARLGLRGRPDWSAARSRERAVRLLAARLGGGRYPTSREFRAAGLGGLYLRIARAPGGHAGLAAALDLPRLAPGQRRLEHAAGEPDESPWSDPDERARAVSELAARLDPPGRYPTEREFITAGLGGLHAKVKRSPGGHAALAAALGLRRARPARWSDAAERERAVVALAAGLDPPGRYPSRSQFAAAGLADLYAKIDRSPGRHAGLAVRLGLRRRMKNQWTAAAERARAVRELAGRLAPPGRYPSRSEFADAGLAELCRVIDRLPGAHDAFATELGLRRMQLTRWADPRARAHAVAALVSELGLDRYPSQTEFRRAGQGGLYKAIEVSPGRHAGLAAELRLPRLPAGRRER